MSDLESSALDSSESEAESDNVVQESGIYNPYQFEPSEEDGGLHSADNTEEQDEDGLSPRTLDQRQEGLLAVNSWCVDFLALSLTDKPS